MFNSEGIAKIAERKIQEAIEEGQFDDLPGKGKPLAPDDDLVTPAHLRAANKILKNANALPEWVQLRKDIEHERKEIAALRARLVRENQSCRARIAGLEQDHPNVTRYAAWHAKNHATYLRRLKGVNTWILKFCMSAPSTAEPLIPYRITAEMETFEADFSAPSVAIALPPAPEERPGRLRSLARLLYQEGRGSASAPKGRQSSRSSHPGYEGEDVKRSDVPEDGAAKP